jgi:two-component system response regulator NreC
MPIRLLIVDDHGVLRAGLVALLSAETGMEVVGEADDQQSAVAQAVETKPDVVLMDISMPESGGIEATRQITQLLPEVKVLVLTMHEDKGLMQEAISAGAMGYLLKRAIKSDLLNAIHTVMRREMYIHPAMARLLFQNGKTAPPPVPAGPDPEPLTTRELEILRLIAQGYTNNQMADLLSISVRTVEYHRSNLTGKLNLHSRVELMKYAEERGLN